MARGREPADWEVDRARARQGEIQVALTLSRHPLACGVRDRSASTETPDFEFTLDGRPVRLELKERRTPCSPDAHYPPTGGCHEGSWTTQRPRSACPPREYGALSGRLADFGLVVVEEGAAEDEDQDDDTGFEQDGLPGGDRLGIGDGERSIVGYSAGA